MNQQSNCCSYANIFASPDSILDINSSGEFVFASAIEIYSSQPYIDFNNGTYNTRIGIESSTGDFNVCNTNDLSSSLCIRIDRDTNESIFSATTRSTAFQVESGSLRETLQFSNGFAVIQITGGWNFLEQNVDTTRHLSLAAINSQSEDRLWISGGSVTTNPGFVGCGVYASELVDRLEVRGNIRLQGSGQIITNESNLPFYVGSCNVVTLTINTTTINTNANCQRVFASGYSVTNPAYSFQDRQSLGMYSSGASNLDFSCDGSNILSLTNSTATLNGNLTAGNGTFNRVLSSAGTASTPAYGFQNRSGLGLYSRNGSEVNISCDGSNSITFAKNYTMINTFDPDDFIESGFNTDSRMVIATQNSCSYIYGAGPSLVLRNESITSGSSNFPYSRLGFANLDTNSQSFVSALIAVGANSTNSSSFGYSNMTLSTTDNNLILQSILQLSNSQLTVFRSVRPNIDASIDLGSANFQWNNIYSANAVIVSDIRFKEDVSELSLERAVGLIMNANPITYRLYNRSSETSLDVGFSAQSLYQQSSDLNIVQKPKDENTEKWTYNPAQMIPILVKVVQDLEKRIRQLEQK